MSVILQHLRQWSLVVVFSLVEVRTSTNRTRLPSNRTKVSIVSTSTKKMKSWKLITGLCWNQHYFFSITSYKINVFFFSCKFVLVKGPLNLLKWSISQMSTPQILQANCNKMKIPKKWPSPWITPTRGHFFPELLLQLFETWKVRPMERASETWKVRPRSVLGLFESVLEIITSPRKWSDAP